MILNSDFYNKSTIDVAKELLGCYLYHNSPEGLTVGKIVETEAYLHNDPASHAFKGESIRTKAMFGDPGMSYIYFIYGAYYCFNVTTSPKGVGEAVLIRALEPIKGIQLMRNRRSQRRRRDVTSPSGMQIEKEVLNLTNGPAKLVIAMGIRPDQYGHDLRNKPLMILSKDHFNISRDNPRIVPTNIITTTRIGITKAADLPLRFYIKDNPFISK